MSGAHQDGDEFSCESFDGPGGRLAHTCLPKLKNAAGNSFSSSFWTIFVLLVDKQFAGNIHFDDSENWTLCSTMGINFFQVKLWSMGQFDRNILLPGRRTWDWAQFGPQALLRPQCCHVPHLPRIQVRNILFKILSSSLPTEDTSKDLLSQHECYL